MHTQCCWYALYCIYTLPFICTVPYTHCCWPALYRTYTHNRWSALYHIHTLLLVCTVTYIDTTVDLHCTAYTQPLVCTLPYTHSAAGLYSTMHTQCCWSALYCTYTPPFICNVPYTCTAIGLHCTIYRCPRRNVPDFGRVFLRSNYTDINQNTYIQSSMVTETLAREKCGLLWCLRSILCPWRDPLDLHCDNPAVACSSQRRPWLRNRCSECIVVGSQWTTMTRVRVFL